MRQRKARRIQRLGGKEFTLPPLCAAFEGVEGYSLHAGVLIGARDRKGLCRLAGYIARPPLALDRVAALPGDWPCPDQPDHLLSMSRRLAHVRLDEHLVRSGS